MPRNEPIFHQERIELDFKDTGLHGSVPQLGRVQTLETRLPTDITIKHGLHEGILEVHYVAKGSQTWQIANREYHTRGGDMFITLPGEEHGVGDHDWNRMLAYWIRIRLNPDSRTFLNFPKPVVRPLLDKLLDIHSHSRIFKTTPKLQRLFDCVILADAYTNTAIKPFSVSMALLELIAEVSQCIDAGQTQTGTAKIATLLKYIDEHIEETELLTNDELARRISTSLSRLQINFRQQTGTSPAVYVMRKKIERAEALLPRRQASVTKVAFQLGFSSTQYFATVFKKYTNKHPRDYLSPPT